MAHPRFGILAAIALLFALPLAADAATFASGRTLVVSESPEDNTYLAGTDITVTAALPADVVAAGGTVRLVAPVTGDALLTGGTVRIEHPVTGDVRIGAGNVSVSAPVEGDLAIAGGTVYASSTARDTRIIGGAVHVNGSGGTAVIYGADVRLSGTFAGDVRVIASDRIALEDGTVITGSLRYDAPQEVALPATATVAGGITYTGSSSYLPTIEEAQTFAIAGAGVFLLVRILAVLIGAALLAGLFPLFSQRVADKALARTPGTFALLALLGFAVVVAAPVLILFLLLSFVGAAVALIMLMAYVLLIMLGYLYAGVLAGAALGRGLLKRSEVTWKLALLGMLVLYLIGTVPVFGGLIAFILFLAATGAIVVIAYRFAFARFAERDAGPPVL